MTKEEFPSRFGSLCGIKEKTRCAGDKPILNPIIEANTGFIHALALRRAPTPGIERFKLSDYQIPPVADSKMRTKRGGDGPSPLRTKPD